MDKVRKLSRIQPMPYKYVKTWFENRFPYYTDDQPTFDADGFVIWLDPMNAQYRYETEKCFKDYFEKHRILFQSVAPKVRMHIIVGTKRRVLKEGVLLEKFTFDDWIRHIEGLE